MRIDESQIVHRVGQSLCNRIMYPVMLKNKCQHSNGESEDSTPILTTTWDELKPMETVVCFFKGGR